MYNMSVTCFGRFVVIVLYIRECSAAINLSAPVARLGSEINITCTINPPEAIEWKRETDSLANCDTISCAIISSPIRYTFATHNSGQTVTLTINPVHTDDSNMEFKCITPTSNASHILVVTSTTTETPGAEGLTTGVKIGIGVTITLASSVTIGVIVTLCKHKAELKAAGTRAAELKATGTRAAELKATGTRLAELKATGTRLAELKATGTMAAELKATEQRAESWRCEFKPVDDLEQLEDLKEKWSENAQYWATSCSYPDLKLVCVLQYSTPNKNEQLSATNKETLARNLESVLQPILYAGVTVSKHKYTITLPGCSLTALLEVIKLIREEQWNECLREMEKTLQNTTLRTQFEEDSLRTCVANFEDLWKRENTEVKTNVHNN